MAEPKKSIEHWQEKYRTLVREQAANEERYEKQLHLLRHTVVRVGTVAQGTDEHLDALLESLKKELRHKGMTRGLLQVIRDIEQTVTTIEREKSTQAVQWSDALGQILDLLAGTVPAERLAAIEQLRAEAARGVSASQLGELLAQLQVLLVDLFAQAEPAPDGDTTQLVEAAPEQPYSVVGEAITAVLQDLIEHIKPPVDALDSVARVQRAIQQGLNWYELVPTLEELSLVVLSTLFNGQKDFEQYLKQLFEQLAQMHVSIDSVAQGNVMVQDGGQQLSESMRVEIAELSRVVEQSADLDTLKTAVSKGLEAISGRLAKFTAADSSTQSALKDHLTNLAKRVESLQKEATTARELLQRQKQKALLDPLTKLPNRQAYNERSVLEFKRWQRYKRPLSLVVGDIDLFKNVNDTYGHLAGDKVLTVIAQLLSHRLRQTDFIARYGGEEIVFLLPETTSENAMQTMDSVRQQVSECGFHFTEQAVQITMTFGVTELVEGDTLDTAFGRADKALYQGKNSGRNQCVLM
ncbi:MAG: GGDEF domain-containing protein [Pseudomonadales bacterium]